MPAAITGILWALPGDPASNLCPSGICSDIAREELIARWHLDSAPGFYVNWLGGAITGDFGKSISAFPGESVGTLLWSSLPNTTGLLLIALIPIVLGTVAAAFGWVPQRLDTLWQGIGLVPAVILALFAAAYIVVQHGPPDEFSDDWWPPLLRLILGGLVLGIADGALAGAIMGTRGVFDREVNQRYIGIALLRGESILANALPNVLPALVGQFRGRVLHLLSGAVIVEVVVQINGIGDLLWVGTLKQDFFLVLAAAWGFALLSASMLLLQAVTEVGVAMYVRHSPTVPA